MPTLRPNSHGGSALFDLFKTPRHSDPELGELRRSRGLWRGELVLDGARTPLAIAGPRSAPDPGALALARSVAAAYPAWRAEIARALFEHYEPYAEAVAAGEEAPPGPGWPTIAAASEVWPHVQAAFVAVRPLDGPLMVEIGYRVAWDDEHTLGARLRDGRLAGLNGSVLEP